MQYFVHWANNETEAIKICPNAHQKKWRYIVHRLNNNFSQLITTSFYEYSCNIENFVHSLFQFRNSRLMPWARWTLTSPGAAHWLHASLVGPADWSHI